ncbi:uncharacterized protein MKK02DRAFT_29264 [Dioszegia hungarica]|uniref:Uncharacterized protein n=1 Tax=Dioszegia hungarica TaxID=4972 RepID=A0AA38HHC8_9TREE|nr:uncharacterized protein MKK02DRAFT_29264 [Dioszegia hungarica]KAI9639144.1 hypothetical protein MKK02DRAFT_29264 [Dioszegia hungarica]
MPSPAPREREEWDEEGYGPDESFLFPEGEGEGETSGEEVRGRSLWMKHVGTRVKIAGELPARFQTDMTLDEVETSTAFHLEFEDMDGSSFSYGLTIAFEDLSTYPSSCETSVSTTSPATPPKRAHLRVFERFSKTYSLTVKGIMERLVCALQGDDDASGGQAPAESGSVVVEVGMPVVEVAVPAPVVPVAGDKKEGAKGQVDGEKEEEEEVERTVTVAVAVPLVVAAEA